METEPPTGSGAAEPAAEDKPTSRKAKLALVSASLFLSLGALELGLRGVGYGGVVEYLPSPQWGYLMRPGQSVSAYGHPVHTNAQGLRGPELEAPKKPGTQRFLFVGDSVTYGGGQLRDEELFVRRFEARARAEGHAVEAVNLSAPGWSPQNWIAYIDANGLLDADFVVLILPECDLGRPFRRMEEHGFTSDASSLRVFSSLSKLRDVVWPPTPHEADADVESVKNVEAVRRLAEKAPPGGLLVAFVPGAPSMPAYARHWPKFEPVAPNPLDLRQKLDDPSLFLDRVHLNKAGQERMADALWERLSPTLR
jgi:hypothetical protein